MDQQINTLDIANSPAIWMLAALSVAMIIAQVVLFLRLAYGAAKSGQVNLNRKQCNRALRAGVISAIGPAFGVFIVMIGLIAVLGGPMSWLRLSVIGGATTELTAAKVGAAAAGGDIAEALSLIELSTAWWTMTINACGWLVVTLLFASRMEKLRGKIGGGDSRWMEIFSSAATLGIFGAFVSEYLVVSLQAADIDFGTIAATVGGAAGMWILMTVSKKYVWLKEYCLGLAMVIGLAAAIVVTV